MSKKQSVSDRPRPDWRERIGQLVNDAPPLTEWQLEVLRRLMVRPGGPFKGLANPSKDNRAA